MSLNQSTNRCEPLAAEFLVLVTDAAHARALKRTIAGLIVNCPPCVEQVLDVQAGRGGGHVIVVVPMDSPQPPRAFFADGPRAFRRSLARAVRSLQGARSAWLRGLNNSDSRLVDETLTELCERTWTSGLADVAVGGSA